MKSEPEEMETDQQHRGEDQEKESTDPRREAGQGGEGEEEEASEEGLEEGYDEEEEEEGPEEDIDEDDERGMEAADEGESPSEPQDLSLVDFSRHYSCKSVFVPETEPGDTDESQAMGTPPRGSSQSGSSKLNCDICGLSCISINVLLVHKRSHTGKEQT